MFHTIVFISLVLVIANTSGEFISPGKALFWSNGPTSTSQVKYNSMTITASQTVKLIEKASSNAEVVVFLADGPISSISNGNIMNKFKSGLNAESAMYVYQNPGQSGDNIILDSVKASSIFKGTKRISASELVQKISDETGNGALNNKAVNSFEVSLKTTDDISAILSVMDGKNDKIMFVVVSEPSVNAVLPEKVATVKPSASHRRLADSDDTTTSGGNIYYKPSGAEYSIYYADTYLYLTPDIFTGLMTGLFFFFVVLIGTSCLGSIQGMSMFYDKCPPVGKEA